MNRFILLLVFGLSLPLTARADDASHRAKAEEMIALAHVDRLTTQVIDRLLQETASLIIQQSGGSLSPEKKIALEDFQKKLVAVVDQQIGWKAVEPAFADIYAKSFTEEQLDAIIAFYRSPAGAALMDKMPTINQQANEMMQAKIVALQPQVKQMFQDFQKSQAPATPPASAAPTASPKPTPPTLGPDTPK